MSNSNSSSGGIGILGLLTLIFVVLKLTGEITWSWWWVVSPLWLPFCIVIGIIIGIVIMFIVGGLAVGAGINVFENKQKIKDALKRLFLKEKNGNS